MLQSAKYFCILTLSLLVVAIPFSCLSGCSALSSADKIPVKEIYDLPYYTGADADDEKHKLNLFLPEGIQQAPVMIWIHGGAWAFGDRKGETKLARHFAAEGIAVAVISYRLSPGTWRDPSLTSGIQHPEHIRDVARAFAWVYDQAGTYGYDQRSIFVSGYSAGAHLSALLALDPTYLREVGRSIRDIKAAIPIAGAYDIKSYYYSHLEGNGPAMADGHVKAVFGETMEQLTAASPTTYIQNKWIPMLVISETDTYDYTLLFEEAAKKAGNDKIEFEHIRDKDHRSLFFNLFEEESVHRDKIVAYIQEHKIK